MNDTAKKQKDKQTVENGHDQLNSFHSNIGKRIQDGLSDQDLMKIMPSLMRAKQFAAFHGGNIRTLHYYDDKQIFQPAIRSESGYRYYLPDQSITFEYIKMLKEMNLSLSEIEDYMKNPNEDKFCTMLEDKLDEVHREMEQLRHKERFIKRKLKDLKASDEKNLNQITIEMQQGHNRFVYENKFDESDLELHFRQAFQFIPKELLSMGLGSFHNPLKPWAHNSFK